MHHPSKTPMCSCSWPVGGGEAPFAQPSVSASKCTMASQWYPPLAPSFNFVTDTPPSNNSREMRNRAEKLRRDKLNSYIGELATLVPMVAGSAKRMDKTSILRLTVTHLRLHQFLPSVALPNSEYSMVDQMALEQILQEQLEGFLLILTPNGKIVFVSHTVEQILGHLQTDLMGQSIYSITSPEDHEKLRLYLSTNIIDSEWRRYFKLHLSKAGPRSESRTFETFIVMGMMRSPNTQSSNKHPRDNTATPQQQQSHKPNNVLIFFVKLYRPPALMDMLIEANKDEYITRHLIDGRIVNCDHRISFVAGYMIEEVSGMSAFRFMHREDVRWTMIGLRQMYDSGESGAWSCYRLLSRTGQFIYLRTSGYLEVDNKGLVESFVCVNTLVDEEEGIRLNKEMKERYSVWINATIPQLGDGETSQSSLEDPAQLQECIKLLITDHYPISPKTEHCTSPKPSAPHENEDCYQTEVGTDTHALELKTKIKRVSSDEDDSWEASGVHKRAKRRQTHSPCDANTTTTTVTVFGGPADAPAPAAGADCGVGLCRPASVADMLRKEQGAAYQAHAMFSHNVSL